MILFRIISNKQIIYNQNVIRIILLLEKFKKISEDLWKINGNIRINHNKLMSKFNYLIQIFKFG